MKEQTAEKTKSFKEFLNTNVCMCRACRQITNNTEEFLETGMCNECSTFYCIDLDEVFNAL